MNTAVHSSHRTPFTALAALLLAFCAALPSFAFAQSDVPATQQAVIEIVRLQHRDPEVVREAIAPHLDERGAISQIDHNLIISTSRANLIELEALIAEVDTPLKQFLVRVDFNFGGANTQNQSDGSSLSTINTADVREHPTQNLIVTEGEFAYFNRTLAMPRTSVSFGPFGLQLEEDNQESKQSFTVQANLRGEQVALALSLSQTLAGGATTASASLNTTLTVDLNRWVTINPRDTFAGFEDDRTRFATTGTAAQGDLAVRIELMP